MVRLDWKKIDQLIDWALNEDIGSGDLTTDGIIEEETQAKGIFLAKNTMVLAGIDIVPRIFKKSHQNFNFKAFFKDGDSVPKSEIIATIEGNAKVILSYERVVLNFLQRLSGIATYASKFAAQVEGTKAKIVDTRKTTPGWRVLEKYAVSVGGGKNHRFGLFDAVLIKDNHIKLSGGIKEAVERIREFVPPYLKVEVEASNLKEVEEALQAGAEIVMLDNMGVDEMKKAVERIDGKAVIEVSGGVNLSNIREIALMGVDLISIGALTHSPSAVDISMKVEGVE
ncbi:MAG: nicotinate-nucleotide diphosphorylase (carboxylating) [Candidatus Schekmanbacteria bacterium RIFCSPHIGHO2_02_FULL_38_11]|uniref:Probable nicotinate-nucleotide pyrophosphorylase [carboxylating] n=1 Tax=Candidatus Schekmanbacteria bacterium RIFCSPLOWO2_12_FULL_38_15 TaxID=1817883 RepID=A0A1F7SHU1_9BACT|nr:MAG: nicotinate-nucleotide diphosphorylase (carboxylating) [Candidatus Schekmanbacteria bacterium RIFCSPLOWO2_12_FULL_38_15]OGL54785.1 MAG: nicotinate-nucleotide diphosphorylase (carboxylating) [Candidatus Schekmanbacteria bacterium RIFCSPHIGHO2_02_FULL_38_11]